MQNKCKPDAGFQKILENFEEEAKHLEENDTMAILITKYENFLYFDSQKYVKLLSTIIRKPDRKFNVIITGLRYNSKHDRDIYHTNDLIANMSQVNENVKYLDPNMTDKNVKYNNYISIKNLVTENVIACLNRRFQGSSSLRFIKCQQELIAAKRNKDTNFQKTQVLIPEP